MSTPTESGPSEPKNVDRRMSLGKYVKRMSSVFKREKPKSPAVLTPTAPPPPAPEPVSTKEEITNEKTAPVAPEATVLVLPSLRVQLYDRNAMQQERARALFAKYGLKLETHEWITAPAFVPPVQRVEKAIRMRVHRSCHRCGTIYGSDKQCLQCEHKRCKKCPRYPKKKTQEKKPKDKELAEKPQKKRVLTITTRSGTELAYQPAKQRIRRTCHKCETMFSGLATTCNQCEHVRCTKCPREPAKLTKWPVGYPGDAEPDSDSEVEKQLEKLRRTWRKPRTRVRWECEKCHNLFLNGSPQCPGCGHERCDKCTRVKKSKKEEHFDPQLVAAVEAKLRLLHVDDDSSSVGNEAT